MKKIKLSFETKTMILAIILIVLIFGGISWAATCGIIYLICKCLDWEWFTLLRATGIWLVLTLVSGAFKYTVKVNS